MTFGPAPRRREPRPRDSERAMSSERLMTRAARVPGAGSNSNRVTTGPGLASTISPRTPKSSSTLSSWRETSSSCALPGPGRAPARAAPSMSSAGRTKALSGRLAWAGELGSRPAGVADGRSCLVGEGRRLARSTRDDGRRCRLHLLLNGGPEPRGPAGATAPVRRPARRAAARPRHRRTSGHRCGRTCGRDRPAAARPVPYRAGSYPA